ncbi:MAG TPA: Sec-independent protein translocase subunit TatA [Streptosporangiaceae bacterium]
MIGDLFDSPWKILIVAVVLIVLFGSAKLPGAARSLGKSMRILKAEVKDLHEEGTEPTTAAQQAVAAPAVAAQQQLAAQQLGAQQAQQDLQDVQAQQRIDDLQRQLAELKEPAAGAHSAQRTQQPG